MKLLQPILGASSVPPVFLEKTICVPGDEPSQECRLHISLYDKHASKLRKQGAYQIPVKSMHGAGSHRELEADKAKVARQLVSACAAAEDIPRPASYAEQGAAACHVCPSVGGSNPLPSCRHC